MTEKTLAIVGGGLAGLAAAVAAAERGMRVAVFEQSKSLGGRAGSLFDAEIGQWFDRCRHVALGCCTNFLDFCRRTGIDDCFERSSALHFIAPDGARYDVLPSRWLPAPLHLLPGLMKLKYLSAGERWGIVGALRKLSREKGGSKPLSPLTSGEGPGVKAGAPASEPLSSSFPPHSSPLPEEEETIGAWLRRQGQSERAVERFWSVVVHSALGESVDYALLAAARTVFREAFLAARGASDLLLPRLPLHAIFHDRLGEWLAADGVQLHLATPVRQIEGDAGGARAVVLADGTQRAFDAVIVAVSWRQVLPLFTEDLLAAMPALAGVEQIEPAAITAVHLWFDRPVSLLSHAILVGRLSQWVFVENRGAGVSPAAQQCCQVVISASHRLPARSHDTLLAEVRRDLETIWPNARDARLLHARVVVQPAAVFSMRPGVDRFRPLQQTPIENLALAGDWTATGWPATMEGAVTSGYRAVRSLLSPWCGGH